MGETPTSTKPERQTSPLPRLGLILIYPGLLLGVLYVTLFLVGNSRTAQLMGIDALNGELPGRFVMEEVRLGLSLMRVDVYGVALYGPSRERPPLGPDEVGPGSSPHELWLTRLTPSPRDRVLSAREVHTRLAPLDVLLGEIVIREAVVVAPEVLVRVDGKGHVGLVDALTDDRSSDPRSRGAMPPNIRIESARVREGRVLISTEDGLGLRLEGITADEGSFALLHDEPIITADVRVQSGGAVVLPELFGLVDPRTTGILRRYRRERYQDPWGAMRPERIARLQARYDEEIGALVLALGNFHADNFVWVDNGLRIAGFSLELADEVLRGRGRMSLSDDKGAALTFDASAGLTVTPGSPLLSYFAGEAVRNAPRGVPDGRLEVEARGSLAELEMALELELHHLVLGEWPVDRLALSAISAASGRFETAGGGLRVQVGSGLLQAQGWLDPREGHYALELWLDDLSTAWLFGPLAPEADPLVLAGSLATRPSDPSSLEGPGLSLSGGLDAKRLFDLVAARFDEAPGARPLVEARFGSLVWNREAPALLPVTEVVAAGQVSLSPDGHVALSGSGGRGYLELELGQDPLSIRGTVDLLTASFEHLEVVGSTSSLARLVDEGDLRGRAQARLALDGSFSAPEVRIERLAVDDFEAGPLRATELSTEAEVAFGGRLPRLRNGHLRGRDLEVGPLAVTQMSADYAFDGTSVSITDSSFETEYGKIDLVGQVVVIDEEGELRRQPRLDLGVRAGALDLGAVFPELPMAGSATLEARVQGTPSQLQVGGTIRVRDAIAFDEWIDSLDAEFSYSERGVYVPSFALEVAGGRVEGSLRTNADLFPQAGHLWLRDVDLGEIRALASLPVRLGGHPEISLRLVPPEEITGPPGLESMRPDAGYPDIEGSIVVPDLSADGVSVGVVALVVDTYGGEVHAVGRLLHELETEIAVPLDGSPLRVTSRFDRVHFALEAAEGESGARGEVSGGRVSAEIRLGDLFDLVADLGVESVWLETAGRRFETARPIHATYAITPNLEGGLAQYLSIDELSFGSDRHFLEVSGGVRDWSELNLNVAGETSMSLVTLIDAVAEARGVVGVELHLGGTFDDPVPVGEISFQNAAVTPRGLGEEITVESGRLNILEPEADPLSGELFQRLQVDPQAVLSGRALGGDYRLTGEAVIRGFQPLSVALDLDATGTTYRLPGEANITLSRAALELSAEGLAGEDTPEFFLSGSLYVEEGLYFRDYGSDTVLAGSVIGLFDRQGVERYVAPVWEQVPELADLQLNLRIQGPNNVRVRNTVLGAQVDLELRLDLLLTGTLAHPELAGEIDVIAGDITFRNRTFEVQECRLTFVERGSGAELSLPIIESCIAEARIQAGGVQELSSRFSNTIRDFTIDDEDTLEAYTVRVTVSGQPPDNLDLVLESVNASLDQRDILALIFTGQTFDTLTTTSGAGQPGLELVTAELLGFAQSYLQQTLSVDEIVVTPSAGGDGTIIQVSDRVSQRLTVDVDATILGDEENQQRVRGQITLFDWMLLEVFGRSDAENNVEGGGRIRLRFEL